MLKSSISSVTGEIFGDDLGITLTHEHLHMQFHCVYTKVPPLIEPNYPTSSLGKSSFELKNLGIIRQYPYGLPYNLKLDDEDSKNVMIDEVKKFKDLGGKTIVENTTHGISRNIELLQKISKETGVNIIAGTGYYVWNSQNESTLKLSIEEINNLMMKELAIGCEDTNIKCGILGEIASSWPITDFEKRVIEATAIAQQSTNAPVTFHPGRDSKGPEEILRIFAEAGGKVKGVVMSHLDRTFLSDESLLEFASLGTYTQFDLFGTECSYYQLADVDMISDAQRIQKLRVLKDNGHLAQILMSHDIHTKHRLANFGGHGFAHILQNIAPKMKVRGFTEDDLKAIMIQNPRNWLMGTHSL